MLQHERRKYAGKKFRLTRVSNSQPPGHESDMLTTEPPGRGWTLSNDILNLFELITRWMKSPSKVEKKKIDWLIERCFTPLSTIFQSNHGNSSHYSWLSWVSPVLGWALKCLDTPAKKPRGSSAARNQDPWITSQTLYQRATQDPGKKKQR